MKRSIKNFELYCAEHHLRITPPRLTAFKIVHKAKKPITAYDVLGKMGDEIKNPKPPTAYRALDFLSQHGFIHRIESLNAYVSCDASHKHKGSQFMICDTCGEVGEIHLCSLPQALEDKVQERRFDLHHWNTELHGTCKKCK